MCLGSPETCFGVFRASTPKKMIGVTPSMRVFGSRFFGARSGASTSRPDLTSAHMCIGMELVLMESHLPPKVARSAPAEVVGIELHPRESTLPGRPSLASHGCLLLGMMPKCIYVRIRDCNEIFLTPAKAASQPGLADGRGVLAVQTVSRPWKDKPRDAQAAVSV